jgi:hypothetical protein
MTVSYTPAPDHTPIVLSYTLFTDGVSLAELSGPNVLVCVSADAKLSVGTLEDLRKASKGGQNPDPDSE